MRTLDVIDDSWEKIMPLIKGDPSLVELTQNIMPNEITYPFKEDIFKVFNMPLESIKVVILGQDPYPYKNVPTGKAFAVKKDCNFIPYSLKYIQKEIVRSLYEEDTTKMNSNWKTLEHLSDQGVFLYNTSLTVKSSNPGSHIKYWKNFTNTVIKTISLESPCIWLLWGKHAKSFIPKIKNRLIADEYDDSTIKNIPKLHDHNYILTSPHPVVEHYNKNKKGRASFIGNDNFRKVNQILERLGKQKIKW